MKPRPDFPSLARAIAQNAPGVEKPDILEQMIACALRVCEDQTREDVEREVADWLEQGMDYSGPGAPEEPLKTIISVSIDTALKGCAQSILDRKYLAEVDE
jgi:hypothetical protein